MPTNTSYTRHKPALPFYTSEDAARALSLLQPVGYNRPMPVVPGVEFEFIDAGHLLGSAYARVKIAGGKTILFGGDLGRYGRPILHDPASIDAADVLLVESTYGNRTHLPDDNGQRLAEIVNDTAKRGGKLIIPSFAIGRVEEVLFWLKLLEDARRIPLLPVFIDSPMAGRALQFYAGRAGELDVQVSPGGAWRRHLCDRAHDDRRLGPAVERTGGLAPALDCDRVKRDGDRRTCHCTTWKRRCLLRKTRCFSWGIRRKARGAGVSWTAQPMCA